MDTIADYVIGEIAASLTNDSLHLILLPTEQCNFRCKYCYEDFSVGAMDQSTVQAVKLFVERRLDDLRFLSISWFGGEPLVARSIVEDISAHMARMATEHGGLRYVSDMTTNGYLLDASAVDRFAEIGIRHYQISLDGPESMHDKTRVRANGKGSFRSIWQNLLAIRDRTAPVEVLLRVHLTPQNLPHMPEFLGQLRDVFLQDRRFSVLLHPVEHLGGPDDDVVDIIPNQERPRIMAELESIVHAGVGRGIRPHPTVCYAARANSLLVRANGLVGKCTVALTDPTNLIGRLRPDGSLQIDNARLRPWLRGWRSGDMDTLRCPYSTLSHAQPQLLQIGRKRTNAANE